MRGKDQGARGDHATWPGCPERTRRDQKVIGRCAGTTTRRQRVGFTGVERSGLQNRTPLRLIRGLLVGLVQHTLDPRLLRRLELRDPRPRFRCRAGVRRMDCSGPAAVRKSPSRRRQCDRAATPRKRACENGNDHHQECRSTSRHPQSPVTETNAKTFVRVSRKSIDEIHNNLSCASIHHRAGQLALSPFCMITSIAVAGFDGTTPGERFARGR